MFGRYISAALISTFFVAGCAGGNLYNYRILAPDAYWEKILLQKRGVSVIVYTDQDFRQNTKEWKALVRRSLEKTAKVYEKNFGIALEIISLEGVLSKEEQKLSANPLEAFFLAKPYPPADIAILLTDADIPSFKFTGFIAQAYVGERYLIISYQRLREIYLTKTEDALAAILIHELLHIFGLEWHLQDKKFVGHFSITDELPKEFIFDEETRRFMLINKFRKFR